MYSYFRHHIKFIFKLKALDWFIIFLFTIITFFFIATSLLQDRWITIKFTMTPNPQYNQYGGPDSPYWMSNKIKVGDVQYNSLGKKNLQILSVTSIGFNDMKTWVTASVKAKYLPRQNKYTFESIPLEIGKALKMTINGTSVYGIVTYIQGSSDTLKTYDITVKARLLIDENSPYSITTRGVDPWIADALKKGQIMKDSSKNTVAEILDIETKPAEKVITTYDGKIFIGEDPFKKDVYLTVKLKVIKQEDTYFFMENMPIKIGWSFPLYMEQILITPTIIQIM